MIVQGFIKAAFVTKDNKSIGGRSRTSRRRMALVLLERGPLTKAELAKAIGYRIQPMNYLLDHPWFETSDGKIELTEDGRRYGT